MFVVLYALTLHSPGSRLPWLPQLILLGPKFFRTCLCTCMCVCVCVPHICVYVCVCVCVRVSHLKLMQNFVSYTSAGRGIISLGLSPGCVLGLMLGGTFHAGPRLLSAQFLVLRVHGSHSLFILKIQSETGNSISERCSFLGECQKKGAVVDLSVCCDMLFPGS